MGRQQHSSGCGGGGAANRSAVNYDDFWSKEALDMAPPVIQQVSARFAGRPGVLRLSGGLPPEQTFPFTTASFGLNPAASSASGGAASLDITSALAMGSAQQYNFSSYGYEPLHAALLQLTKLMHKPQLPIQLAVTCGATHAINLAVSCLTNPGDYVIVDEYTYSHALDCIFGPRRAALLPVAMDQEGMVPAALRQVLQRACAEAAAAAAAAAAAQHSAGSAGSSPSPARRPRLLYTIPTGHNPTSIVMSTRRKQELLEVAADYDLIILEDDAYHLLQWPAGEDAPPGLDLPPSFLSLDTAGRVLRIDTLAKSMGPGYRLGWVSGPPALVDKLALACTASCLGPAGLSQVVVAELLAAWRLHGLEGYVRNTQALYAHKAAVAHAAASAELGGLAEWRPAHAGMFMWIKLLGVADAEGIIEELVANNVVVLPGSLFWARKNEPGAVCPHIRVSFAYVDDEQIRTGFQRLGAALRSKQAAAAAAAPSGKPIAAPAPMAASHASPDALEQ